MEELITKRVEKVGIGLGGRLGGLI